MKSDTTPLGVIYGSGEEVVEVDEHGEEHDEIGVFPVLTKKHPSDESGKEEVQRVVGKELECHIGSMVVFGDFSTFSYLFLTLEYYSKKILFLQKYTPMKTHLQDKAISVLL